MSYHDINIPRDVIPTFCQRHHIRRLSLFGSILRDNFRPDSDLDVLVEFEPGHTPGLGFFGMQDELSERPQGRSEHSRMFEQVLSPKGTCRGGGPV